MNRFPRTAAWVYLVRDTGYQAWVSGLASVLLGASALVILLCLSARWTGDELNLGFGLFHIPGPDAPRAAVEQLLVYLGGWGADTAGVLFVLTWTAGFLPSFLEPASAAVLLAKPLPRWQLLLGRIAGVFLFVLVQVAVFVIGSWLALGLRTGVWSSAYLLCVPLLFLHFAVFYSFSALLAVMTRSTVVCVLGSILFWLLCWGMNVGRHMVLSTASLEGIPRSFTFLIEAVYWFLPKPADLGMILLHALGSGEYLEKYLTYSSLVEQGLLQPEWVLLSSGLFLLGFLGLAVHEFATTDY